MVLLNGTCSENVLLMCFAGSVGDRNDRNATPGLWFQFGEYSGHSCNMTSWRISLYITEVLLRVSQGSLAADLVVTRGTKRLMVKFLLEQQVGWVSWITNLISLDLIQFSVKLEFVG